MVNWHIAHLASWQAAFHTKCILSELESMLNRCHINSRFITFHCYQIHCSTLRAFTAHGVLQQQASRPTPSYSWHSLETQSILQEVTASHWLRASIYHRSCSPIDAWHAAQAGTEVTHSLACYSNWRRYTDSGQHSKLNELLSRGCIWLKSNNIPQYSVV